MSIWSRMLKLDGMFAFWIKLDISRLVHYYTLSSLPWFWAYPVILEFLLTRRKKGMMMKSNKTRKWLSLRSRCFSNFTFSQEIPTQSFLVLSGNPVPEKLRYLKHATYLYTVRVSVFETFKSNSADHTWCNFLTVWLLNNISAIERRIIFEPEETRAVFKFVLNIRNIDSSVTKSWMKVSKQSGLTDYRIQLWDQI